jgi:hypothetical protein
MVIVVILLMAIGVYSINGCCGYSVNGYYINGYSIGGYSIGEHW